MIAIRSRGTADVSLAGMINTFPPPDRHALATGAASSAADPIRPAARAVLDIAASYGPAHYLQPLWLVEKIPCEPHADTRVEDALAALVVLEAKCVLSPPRAVSGTWELEGHRHPNRGRALTGELWNALLVRLWALIQTFAPLFGRRPRLTADMLRQLAALAGGGAEAEAQSVAALHHLIASQSLIWDVATNGDASAVTRPPTFARAPGERLATANAQFLREHCTGATPWFTCDSRGAHLSDRGSTRMPLRLTSTSVRAALAADRAFPGGATEALVHLGTYRRMQFITIAPLRDIALAGLVSTLLPTVLRWTTGRYALRALAHITDPTVAAAVTSAAQSELRPIETLLLRLSAVVSDDRAATFGTAAVTMRRLLDDVGQCLRWSDATPAACAVQSDGITWGAAVTLANAQPGRSRTLRLADLRAVLPATAHAFLAPAPWAGELDVLAAPAGVSSAAVVLAAQRYHRDASVRADAREALTARAYLRPTTHAC